MRGARARSSPFVPARAVAGTVTAVSTGPFALRSAVSASTTGEAAVRFQTAIALLAASSATRRRSCPGTRRVSGGCHAPPAGLIAARIAPVALLAQTATALPAGFMASRAPASATFVAMVVAGGPRARAVGAPCAT
jgi:hypothetical protein